jgi:hypothetical protein
MCCREYVCVLACMLLLLLQDELNRIFVGPTFDLSVRLASILNTVFVSCMYCGGASNNVGANYSMDFDF